MPTQQNIDEIASYLKSFEDGTRKHDQANIHGCGSSHCLAGWKTYEDAIKDGLVVNDFSIPDCFFAFDNEWYESKVLEKFVEGRITTLYWSPNEMDYAAQVWGLNEDEADELFEGDLTLDQMKVNLLKIAKTHNLNCNF